MAHSEMLKRMPQRARTIPQTTEQLHVIPIDQRTTSETRSGPGAAYLLAQLGAHASARFTTRLAMLELAPAHAGILKILAGTPGMSQCALAKALGALPSRMVAFVDQLESKGLLERRPNENDRRNHALHLTKAGSAAYHSTSRVAQEHQQALLAGLSSQQQVHLAELLERVAQQQGLLLGHAPHNSPQTSKRSGKNSGRPLHQAPSPGSS